MLVPSVNSIFRHFILWLRRRLDAERIDWQSYEVHYQVVNGGAHRMKGGLSQQQAIVEQKKLIEAGHRNVVIGRTIAAAGWPQLPYEMLKKMAEVPPTPMEELRKIVDPAMRKAAIRLRREVDEGKAKELSELMEVD